MRLNPQVGEIDYKYVRFKEQFNIYVPSLDTTIIIPVGFVCDRESIPLFKGTSIRGGYAHDYLCRYDSVPVVTKKQAADAYLSVMAVRKNGWIRRYVKYWFVRMAWGYFHVHSVNATHEEVSGKTSGETSGGI